MNLPEPWESVVNGKGPHAQYLRVLVLDAIGSRCYIVLGLLVSIAIKIWGYSGEDTALKHASTERLLKYRPDQGLSEGAMEKYVGRDNYQYHFEVCMKYVTI